MDNIGFIYRGMSTHERDLWEKLNKIPTRTFFTSDLENAYEEAAMHHELPHVIAKIPYQEIDFMFDMPQLFSPEPPIYWLRNNSDISLCKICIDYL